MKHNNLLIVLAGITAVVLMLRCVRPPDYPDAPVITYLNMSKQYLKQGKHREDSLTVRFSYTDGDGDLGFPGSDPTPSIFVKDERDSFIRYQYQLPYVEPQGAGNGINGEVSVVVPNTCCTQILPGGQVLSCDQVSVATDTVHYLIYIKDRAGHKSNEIKTGPIILLCH